MLGCLGQEGLIKLFSPGIFISKKWQQTRNLLLQMCLLDIIQLMLFKSG